MKAMLLETPGNLLVKKEVVVPKPTGSQMLIKVNACGV